jgi:hypothetical protein
MNLEMIIEIIVGLFKKGKTTDRKEDPNRRIQEVAYTSSNVI